jgi:hypothetical protein
VSALVAASAGQKRKCRDRLRGAVTRLETSTPGTARGDRIAKEAGQCIRAACAACARCPGI